jgi:hypothetical protein
VAHSGVHDRAGCLLVDRCSSPQVWQGLPAAVGRHPPPPLYRPHQSVCAVLRV